jgi:3-oxoacyl-[acyl-carrier protein] reductase
VKLTLKGKVAIVTGGSRGIGREIVLALAKAGAAVVINYCERPDAAEETLKKVEELGSEGLIYQANVKTCLNVKKWLKPPLTISEELIYLLITLEFAEIIYWP